MPDKLSFGTPRLIPEKETNSFSGVLDGKWFPKNASSPDQCWYASACAAGDIRVFTLTLEEEEEEEVSTDLPCQFRQIGSTETSSNGTLCLALNWETAATCDANCSSTRLVSSYSDGRVAIHNVVMSRERVDMEETHNWTAHCLFANMPTQVWTACFAGDSDDRVVLSGGDDAMCKLWDIRCTTRPAHVLKDFEAGVTVVSTHPRKTHFVAVGSYDESVAVYDIRSPSKPLLKESFGGGIWRIQWHPIDDNRLLLAAMHGGCRAVQLSESWSAATADTPCVQSVKEFTEHKSMAYGADWLVCGKGGAYYEAAASCSFYDQAAYLWDTVAP